MTSQEESGAEHNTPEEFGAYLKSLRQKLNITLQEASQLTGISYSYLSLVEQGKRKPPSLERLKRIADAYGVGRDDLLRRAGHQVNAAQPISLERLEWAFKCAWSDPENLFNFVITTRAPNAKADNELNLPVILKAALVIQYQGTTGRQLLKEDETATLEALLVEAPSTIEGTLRNSLVDQDRREKVTIVIDGSDVCTTPTNLPEALTRSKSRLTGSLGNQPADVEHSHQLFPSSNNMNSLENQPIKGSRPLRQRKKEKKG